MIGGIRVFLCYPSEHLVPAREVKMFVRSVGVDCWFDKDSLVAGEDWDRARSLALKNADVVLLLCSLETMTRNGVYQREVNEALSSLADRRLGTVYIIPLRIEDVPLPPELSRLQYVDFFEASWRRRLAAGLARAVDEAGYNVPAQLNVASAQPDEGGIIPRFSSEELPEGTLNARWFNYALEGSYWEFVNSVITSRAMGSLYEGRRRFAEWRKPSGSSWGIEVSEFYRKGNLVSLTIYASSYFAEAPHPNHETTTINILGESGIMAALDLFKPTIEAFTFLTNYVNSDLKRQFASSGRDVDILPFAKVCEWSFYDHYNFNEAGMQINLSTTSGLPHVLGLLEVYLPWQHVGQFLSPSVRKILLG